MVSKEFSQPFDVDFNWKELAVQPVLTINHISPWIGSLPGNRLLDVSSGQGIESVMATKRNCKVVAQDISKSMLSASYYSGDKVVGCAEVLPYKDKSFDGILIKDTWVFLSPESRMETLNEAFRVLRDSGSALLISEKTNMRVWRQDEEGKLAYREIYPANDNWKDVFEDCLEKYDFSFIFQADSESLIQNAKEVGFCPILREQYSFDSPLAKENRWMNNRGGFVVELKKHEDYRI